MLSCLDSEIYLFGGYAKNPNFSIGGEALGDGSAPIKGHIQREARVMLNGYMPYNLQQSTYINRRRP
jgi:hypothetical protein